MTTTRRSILAAGALAAPMAAAMASATKTGNANQRQKNYVLAPGSWHGGWAWGRVAKLLRDAGHQVFTPSYTGLGDRAHLLSKDITINTFVDDLVNVITSEELSDVILVGHSFGGTPLAGVADRIPKLLQRLVYFDAVLLEGGKSAFDAYLPADREARLKAAHEANGGLAVPVPTSLPPLWGLTPGTPDYDWVLRRLTPHPLSSYTTALKINGPLGNGVACTYIECTAPVHPGLASSKALARSVPGMQWKTFAGPHDAMITHARGIADLLLTQ